MPAASNPQRDRPQQLWLDVARPIDPRPRRTTPPDARNKAIIPPQPAGQMELRIADQPRKAVTPGLPEAPLAPIPAPASAVPAAPPPQSFAAWLLAQGGERGTLGELARAAKLDPHFPRRGSADDARARFSAAGADGDAFAALDDAERAYDRLA